MVKRIPVLLIVVLLSLITGCTSKQSALNIEIPKAAIKQVAANYGENNPEIVRTNLSKTEISYKPMYTVLLQGNFHKGDLQATNLSFSITANGEKAWALTAFNDDGNKNIWQDADVVILP